MIERVTSALTKLGFEVQETSYAHLTENTSLKELDLAKLPEGDALRILKFFPDLFVMHRTISPASGPGSSH